MGLLDKIKQTVKRKKADEDEDLEDDFDYDDIEDLDDYDGDADIQDDDFAGPREHGLSDLPSAGEEELDDEASEEPPEPENTDPYADQEDDIDLDALADEIGDDWDDAAEAADHDAAEHAEEATQEGEVQGDFDEDYDEDYDGEYDEEYDDEDYYDEGDDRKKMIMLMAAAVVLIGSVIGGAGWWFLGGSGDEVAAVEDAEQTAPAEETGFVLPPRNSGSLNEFKDAEDRPVDKPILAEEDKPQGPGAPQIGPDDSQKNKGFAVTNKETDAMSRVPTTIGNQAGRSQPAPQTQGDEVPAPLPQAQSLNEFAVAPRSELEVEFGLSDGEPSPGVGVIARAASLNLKERLPDLGSGGGLAQAIDPGLMQTSEEGVSLPVIAEDGRQSWQAYARPDDSDGKRLAIVVKEMGMSALATEAVIARFPPEVTLSFSPYAQDAQTLVEQARGAGHEVWLSVPMEPIDFPFVDPGPLGLFTAISRAENIERLELALARIQGFVGVTTDHGTQFVVIGEYYEPILEELKNRGLAVADVTGSSRSLTPSLSRQVGIPWVRSQLAIGASADPGDVNEELKKLEELLQGENRVMVTIMPYPNVLKAVGKWLEGLSGKGITLAPASAFLTVPPPPET